MKRQSKLENNEKERILSMATGTWNQVELTGSDWGQTILVSFTVAQKIALPRKP